MFSLNFRKTGWLARYLIFRASTPFTGPEPYLEFTGEDFGEEKFDELLYLEVEKNGMFFGCPVISRPVQNLANKLNFPKQQGGTILLYLETLFSIALIENESLTSNLQHATTIPYHNRLLKIILLALRYHIPGIFYRIPEDILLTELLAENETLHGALKQFEEELLDSVTLKGYSSLGNRQNNFAFSKLYFFLLWTRAEAKNDKSEPEAFLEMDKELREEMILTFAALIWADDYVDSTEQQVIEKYIEQTKLTEAKQNKLNQRILEPVKIEDIHCSITSVIISSYFVEQLILLSLID
ncbi:MAG: hypothetical protein RPT10_10555, partial [SAR324 cluster bacterium]